MNSNPANKVTEEQKNALFVLSKVAYDAAVAQRGEMAAGKPGLASSLSQQPPSPVAVRLWLPGVCVRLLLLQYPGLWMQQLPLHQLEPDHHRPDAKSGHARAFQRQRERADERQHQPVRCLHEWGVPGCQQRGQSHVAIQPGDFIGGGHHDVLRPGAGCWG